MSHHWDSGLMVREPSWHRLENVVLPDGVMEWEVARQHAGITWEVETEPVYMAPEGAEFVYPRIPGYQAIVRNDKPRDKPKERVLSVRPTSYEVIRNAEFGDLMNTLLGLQDDEHLVFESLMSLYGGRQIVALCYFEHPLQMSWDPSATYRYLAFCSRHDGQGGLRGIPTNVRVQCANTLNLAEMTDGRRVGFTIRHTSNWVERITEIRAELVAARGEGEKWLEFAEQLALWKAGPRQREAYLKRFLPISDAMGGREMANTENARFAIRQILESKTSDGIRTTGYGLLMASTEWSDHIRVARTRDSYVTRQLLHKEEPKARAAKVLRSMAGIK